MMAPPKVVHGTIKKEPVVKQEPIDVDTIPASEDDQDELDAVAEGLLANHEGVDYYEDEGFKIKQVKLPVVVNRLIFELYSINCH